MYVRAFLLVKFPAAIQSTDHELFWCQLRKRLWSSLDVGNLFALDRAFELMPVLPLPSHGVLYYKSIMSLICHYSRFHCTQRLRHIRGTIQQRPSLCRCLLGPLKKRKHSLNHSAISRIDMRSIERECFIVGRMRVIWKMTMKT